MKRIAKLKDQQIVSGACGTHTMSLISKDGKVFMFGNIEKDIIDKSTGKIVIIVKNSVKYAYMENT